MNTDFHIRHFEQVDLLTYIPWEGQGISHGMTLASLSFHDEDLPQSARLLCRAIGATDLCLPRQVHGDGILDLRQPHEVERLFSNNGDGLRRIEADAVVCGNVQPIPGRCIAFGVMTADCVPLVLRADGAFAVVHAGWRGLANGVIGKTLAVLRRATEGVAFAAAGAGQYEVGREVIEAIGQSAVYTQRPGIPDRYLLDTAATAIKQLRALEPSIAARWSGICTIEDQRFHSHRREQQRGRKAGRAVSFVCPPSR